MSPNVNDGCLLGQHQLNVKFSFFFLSIFRLYVALAVGFIPHSQFITGVIQNLVAQDHIEYINDDLSYHPPSYYNYLNAEVQPQQPHIIHTQLRPQT